jgi:hypothetical protein
VRRAPASNTLNPSIATAPTTIRMQECPRLAWQRQAPPPGAAANPARGSQCCRRRGASHARRQHGLVGWGGICGWIGGVGAGLWSGDGGAGAGTGAGAHGHLESTRTGSALWAPTAWMGSKFGYGVSYAIASLSCTSARFSPSPRRACVAAASSRLCESHRRVRTLHFF